MKVILWATLTANGNYARSDAQHIPKQEALADFGMQIQKTKCFIVGRTTFEGFQASGAKPDPSIRIVVVSSQQLEIPGVTIVPSPEEAIRLLEEESYTSTILAGGETLHNTFLNQGLVNEIIFNITPTLEDKGYKILLEKGKYEHIELLSTRQLGGGIIQVCYKI